MRPKAYIAAAATGLIAPVVFAMPALAQDNDFDDDNRDGDRNNSRSVDRNDSDRNISRDSNGDIEISAASSETTGDVSFLIEASDLDPFMPVEVNSPDIDAACTGSDLDGFTAEADRNGDLEEVAMADDCVPGTYRVSISEQDTPFRTFSETVTVD